jgi:hypothetical protein
LTIKDEAQAAVLEARRDASSLKKQNKAMQLGVERRMRLPVLYPFRVPSLDT